jgi:TFIIF-interacting CTD phosphatase-like protein
MRNNSISSNNNIIFNNTEPRTFDNNEESIDLYKTTFKLIEEIETETKLNKTKEIKNNIYNKLKLFLVNLNKNEYLTNKMTSIEQKQDNDNIDINLETMLNEVNSEEEISTQKIFTLPLPKNEDKEFKYTIFIELDETIVHYYEEGENYFVKVRQGTDDFLSTMNEFCEIIIVSTSSKEYTDIILENLNKDKKLINTAIYKDICDTNNLILDFRKINRDIKKCIFICHDKNDFFKAPESNIIELKEFNGEEQDKEIVFLQVELMKLKIGMDDIRDIIKEINNTLEKKRNNEKEDDMENVEQRE